MPFRKAHPERRGAALLLSLLVLLVLVAIMIQLNIATMTDARIGRNDLSLTAMDLAIESALLEVFETLEADAATAGEEEEGLGGGVENPFGGGLGGLGGEGEQSAGSVDSRQDDWATPIRTEINGIRLRILVQDEDSKINVLTILSEDPDEADKALERVIRVLDWCREGTKADIDSGDARTMAEEMLEHLRNRSNSFLPRPDLVTDLEHDSDVGLPLSLREFVCLESFTEDHFRDFLDSEDVVVHSIGSFLTCFTAVTTRDQMSSEDGSAGGLGGGGANPDGEAGGALSPGGLLGGEGSGGAGSTGGDGSVGNPSFSGQSTGSLGTGSGGDSEEGGGGGGGVSVNINTAPPVVLKALMDDRDVAMRLWDDVIEWRNEEDEEALEEDTEPPLDEFGEPILIPKIFEDLSDLNEFDDYRDLDALLKGEIDNLLTVESSVFSIYITARKPTGSGAGMEFAGSKEEIEEEERNGQALTRTVRCVVWRRQNQEEWELVPLERWEVVDYMPYEVLDFSEEER